MSAPALVMTSFGRTSTAQEVVEGLDLRHQRVIVTGGSSGLGAETARALASAGASVTLAVRDTAAGERAAAAILAATGNDAVRVRSIDLADLASVAAFVQAWGAEPVDVLINNAGVMALPHLTLSVDGCEMQFATNHLGHFALAVGLHDALAAAGDARIVSLTSRGHLRSSVVFEDINFQSRSYEPFLAYGQSKTATILFAVEANRRWAAEGITANAVFPGVALDTHLTRYVDEAVVRAKAEASATPVKSVAQGAATIALAAVSPELQGIGGRYLEDCHEGTVVEHITPDTPGGVAAYALDPAYAERLWAASARITRTAKRPV